MSKVTDEASRVILALDKAMEDQRFEDVIPIVETLSQPVIQHIGASRIMATIQEAHAGKVMAEREKIRSNIG